MYLWCCLYIILSSLNLLQAELGSTAIPAKNEPNNNNNTESLRGIKTPSKQQQPVPQKQQQQQHPLIGMQQLQHQPPSLSSLTAQGLFTVNINRAIKIAQKYK